MNKDYSNKDIRGFDFSNDDLTNANFQNATAGISPHWEKVLKILSCFLAFFAGLTSAYSGAIIAHIITNDADELSLFSLLVVGIVTGFMGITLSKGWGKTLTDSVVIIIAFLLLITILIAIIAFSPENREGFNIALGAEFTILGSLGIIVGIVNHSLAMALAKVVFRNYTIQISSITFVVGAIVGALCGVREMSGFTIASLIALITLSLGIHVGLEAMKRNQKYEIIHWLTTTITMIGSTKFIGANLTNADFTGASLHYTDFTNANLTGTRWDDVKGLESARRETINTYQTLDLALKDTINPNTFVIALQQLSQKYPLELLAIEGRSQQEIRLHAKVIEKEYQGQLSQELNQIYRQLAVLSPNDSGNNLDERNPTIRILKELLEKAIDTPKNYFNTEGKIDMTQGKGNVNISGTEGGVSGIAAAGENQTFTGVALGEISGNVTNTINQLPDVSTSDQLNIKDLLTQLQTAIENEQDLDEDDKSQALQQVKTIAEAAQNPQDTKMQKLAKGAKNTLHGIMSNLPTATKLVEEVNNLLPTILKIFGL
jgi:uncharacterized protein YjbI with pentapeptide repeats